MMWSIAGGIILAVLGLQFLSGLWFGLVWSVHNPDMQAFYCIMGVLLFGIVLCLIDSTGVIAAIWIGGIVLYRLTRGDNPVITWPPRKDLGRRIR